VPPLDEVIPGRSLIADLPLLTCALIVFLIFIFGAKTRLAFDIDAKGNLSARSLTALGAISRDLVIGWGQWWRVGLAPLLHASNSHLYGNCFALFIVGMRLEPMVGRGWLGLIFVVSALGGRRVPVWQPAGYRQRRSIGRDHRADRCVVRCELPLSRRRGRSA
jgi:membrane associated rhomboid family serine protease